MDLKWHITTLRKDISFQEQILKSLLMCAISELLTLSFAGGWMQHIDKLRVDKN